MASVLLTGACGYLGAAIGVELQALGVAYEVLPCRLEQLQTKCLRGYQKVIHAAGALRGRGQVALEQSNRIGSEKLLAALDGTPGVLFISSRAVYGHQPGRICTEADPAQPADSYALTKLAAEQAIRASGLTHAILRIPRLIGESPAGIGYGFHADALRHFLAGEPVCRYLPDRLDDSLDVRALAGLCAGWADGSRVLPQGITNVPGVARSLHLILAEFAAAAERFGGKPVYDDRANSEMPWPFLSDQRFLREVGPISQRPDGEIADACYRKVLSDQGAKKPEPDRGPDQREH